MFDNQNKQRIIQEFVPGKQITLAHIIANPDKSIYKKMGVIDAKEGALGIMTITPAEGAIIGADMAVKASNVDVVFLDRFNGTLVVTGSVSDVESSLQGVIDLLCKGLHFTPTEITKS